MKKVAILVLTMMLTMGLMACGTQELSEEFDEATVKAAAEELVGYVNVDDVEGFCSVPMSAQMKEAMTVETTQSIFDQYLSDKGAFIDYTNCVVVGATDDAGVNSAVVLLIAKYENKTVSYTISYDVDMNLIGFYLK